MTSTGTTSQPTRLQKKLALLHKPKCLNGIKELNIESDGRAILCQMGSPESPSLTTKTIRDFDYDIKKFFDSPEVRDKRLNCQGCKINCQQHIYFEPGADNIFLAIFRLMLAPFTGIYRAHRPRR